MSNDDVKTIKDLLKLHFGYEHRIELRYDDVTRSSYGQGEWNQEPDTIIWKERTSYGEAICSIKRNSLGGLCGYVDVPVSHPISKAESYDDIDIDCHGGLTFLDCNITTGRVIIGFDCGHLQDIQPKMPGSHLGIYKNVDYVLNEIKKILKQLEVLYLSR